MNVRSYRKLEEINGRIINVSINIPFEELRMHCQNSKKNHKKLVR